jgi:misacylated tRNA(Ala) deacylase
LHTIGDPLLKELETWVIACAASSGIEAPKDKKKKLQAIQQETSVFEVLLQDTILFPEGGGQPSDIGYIKDENGTCWDVLEIKRRGGQAIHYVKGSQATAESSFVVGSRVTVALGEEGFKRRYDHVRLWISLRVVHVLIMCTPVLDVYTYLPTFDIRAPRDMSEFTHPILVFDTIPESSIYRSPTCSYN